SRLSVSSEAGPGDASRPTTISGFEMSAKLAELVSAVSMHGDSGQTAQAGGTAVGGAVRADHGRNDRLGQEGQPLLPPLPGPGVSRVGQRPAVGGGRGALAAR